MKKSIKAILVASLLFSVFSGGIVLAQGSDPIGRILVTKGSVQAQASGGQTRALRRGSEIFVAESVITGPDGFAQIRMVDGAQIALKEGTEFAFNQYTFDSNPATGDNAAMELLRGGFRTISGSIGEGGNDDYVVETAFASIGVRGTVHEAVIDFNTLFTGVYDGGTTVSNGFGSVDTGLGGNFDYTQTSQGQAPRGMLRQPNQLGRININPGVGANAGGDDDDAGGDGGDGTAGDGGDGTAGDGGDGGNAPNFNGLGAPGNNQGGGNTPAPGAQTNPNIGLGAGNNNGNNGGNGGGSTNTNTDQAINPAQNIRNPRDIRNPGSAVIDTDGDGVPDDIDAFPNNPNESVDSDGDGVGDNSDAFPNNPLETRDSDGDGVGDNSDAFPNDPSASRDTDGDGVADRFDAFPEDPSETLDSDGDGVGDNADAFPNDPTRSEEDSTTGGGDDGNTGGGVIDEDEEDDDDTPPAPAVPVAVLSPAQYDLIANGVRRGFTLSRNFWQTVNGESEPAIFFGASSDASGGNPVIIADLLDVEVGGGNSPNPVTGDIIFDSVGAASPASPAGGIPSFYGEFNHDVQWGVWGPAQGLRIYGNRDNNSQYINAPAPLLWVSTIPTDLSSYEATVSVVDEYLFMGDQNFIGGSSLGGLTDLSANFVLDLGTGNIRDGEMEFCLGGDCKGFVDSQFWSFDFAGTIAEDNKTILGYVQAESADITYLEQGSGITTTGGVEVEGIVDGLFTGNLEAFVGGLNLYSEGIYGIDLNDDGIQDANEYILIPVIVDGIFLLEREDRFTSGELQGTRNALLVQEAYEYNLTGFGQLTGGDDASLFFLDDTRPNPFSGSTTTPSRYAFRANEAAGGVIIDQAYSNTAFDLAWERWDGPLLAAVNNYDENSEANLDGYDDGLGDVAFFATFEPSDANNLRGRFSNVINYVGQNNATDPISALTMEFDVDFQAGSISNGNLQIETINNYRLWNIFFSSGNNAIQGNTITDINILEGDGEDTVTGLYDIVDGTFLITSNIIGDINGAFVDDDTAGTQVNELAFLNSFYFQDVSSPGSTDTVQGLALVGGEIENRFNLSAGNTLGRLAMVSPTQTEDGVLNALADNSVNYPVFVENNVSVSGPGAFEVLSPFDTSYVIHNLDGLSFTQTDDTYDVILGKWRVDTDPALDILKFTDSVDYFINTPLTDDVFWASVATQDLESPWIGAPGDLLFMNSLLFKGGDGDENGLSAIDNAKAYLSADLVAGTVSSGIIKACAGGDGNCGDGASIYEITIGSGSIVDGYFEPDSAITQIKVNGVLENVEGSVSAIFTGFNSFNEGSDELYDAVVLGFNFIENGDASKFVSGNVLIERDDRFTSVETFDETALLIMNTENINLFDTFESNGTDGDYTVFFSSDQGGDQGLVARTYDDYDGGTLVTDQLFNVEGFNLDWATWEGALLQEQGLVYGKDNVDTVTLYDESELPGIVYGDSLLWANYQGDLPPQNLIGTYSQTAPLGKTGTFIGGQGSFDTDGAPFTIFDDINDTFLFTEIQFKVDLFNGIISDGIFFVGTGSGNTWELNSYDGTIEEGKLFFNITNSGEGSDAFGTYTPFLGTSMDITSADLTGAFVDRNIPVEFDHGEGILLGFSLEAQDDDVFLNGLALTETTFGDYSFIDLRYFDLTGFPFLDIEGLPIDGIPEPITDLGFILAADHANVMIDNSGQFTHEYIFPALVGFENDGITPVFLEVNPAALTLPPEPDVVFRLNGGYQYAENPSINYSNVTWGFWEDGETEFPTAFISKDLEVFEDDFDRLFWAVVEAPGISGPNGSFTYAKRISDLSMTQTNYGSNITDIFTAFDINFTSGSVSNGFMRVCVNGSDGCSGATRWEANFTGSVEYGSLTTQDTDPDGYLLGGGVSGNIYAPNNSPDGTFTGDINGAFTGYSNYNDPYDVFVGGFNFDEDAASRFISGLFLLERDDRYNPSLSTSISPNYSGALVAADLATSGNRAMFIDANGTLVTGLHGMDIAIWNDTHTVFSDDSGNIYNIGHQDDLYWGEYHYDAYNDAVFGIWYGSDVDGDPLNPDFPVKKFTDNLDTDSFLSYANSVTFFNYKPASPFTQLTGRFSSDLNSFISHYALYFEGETGNGNADQFGVEDDVVDINFDLNFGSGQITNGSLKARVRETPCSTCNFLNYEVGFNGSVSSDMDVMFTPTSQNFYVSSGGEVVAGTESTIDEVIMAGGLTRNGDTPIVGGIFGFREQRTISGSPVDTFIGGYFTADGFVEDRLTASELQAMENNIGLLANQTSGGYVETLFSSSSSVDSPKLGFLDDVTNQSDFSLENYSDELLRTQLDEVLVENGTGSTNTQVNSAFNVGWGYWATGADALTDHLEGATGVGDQGYAGNNPLVWLSAEPTDLANLTGQWSYSNVSDFMGYDEAGAPLTSVDMGFDVDFLGGTVSNGFLDVVTNAGNWETTFTGAVTGAYFDAGNSIAGTLDGSAIVSGNMKGVFVGTGTNQGFASAFTLNNESGSNLGGTAILDTRIFSSSD